MEVTCSRLEASITENMATVSRRGSGLWRWRDGSRGSWDMWPTDPFSRSNFQSNFLNFRYRTSKNVTFYYDKSDDIHLSVATWRLLVQHVCRRWAIITIRKLWVIGHMGHGSDQRRVIWVTGHKTWPVVSSGHTLCSSEVNWKKFNRWKSMAARTPMPMPVTIFRKN